MDDQARAEGALSRTRRCTAPEFRLGMACTGLLLTNARLIAAATLATGTIRVGLVNSGRVAYAAMAVDTVAVVLMAVGLRGLARRERGRMRRWLRRAASLFVLWVVLSIAWRLVLQALAGTDAETVFYDIFTPEDVVERAAPRAFIDAMLALWLTAAALFVLAALAVLVARHNASTEDRVRTLPAMSWVVAAAFSFLGTLLVVVALESQLGNGALAGAFVPGAVLKMYAAPYVGLYGYYLGVKWGWAPAEEADEADA